MNQKSNKQIVLLVLFAAFSLALLTASPAGAPQRDSAVRRVREIDLGPLGAQGRTGLAFIRPSGRFVSLDRGARAGEMDAAAFTERGERAGSKRMAVAVKNPMNMTFDDRTGRLLILDTLSQRMLAMRASSEGEPETETAYGLDVVPLALNDPQGMTADSDGGLYVLDAAPPRIVRAEFLGDRGVVLRSVVPLSPDLGSDFQGIAFDPRSGHLFVLELRSLRLFELTPEGRLLSSRDLSRVLWGRPQSLTFAPSGDSTDDPAEMSLYVVEKTDGSSSALAKGQITELSLSPLAAASPSAPTVVATLVQNIHTHLFSPPSPDPDGITYYPPRNSLLITDSEVEEMPIYQDANVFEISPTGALMRTANTRSFSSEPTGIVYNPVDGHFFVSDDDAVRINDLNPGSDGIPFTADDTIRRISVSATGSGDPEDVALDTWRNVLYWVDGVNSEVYKASPGPNGIFDGVAPAGDDLVTHFDTTVYGVTDPECISFNTDNGHLYIMGISDAVIAETDPDGNLLRIIDGSATNANKPAALAYAPNSLVPGMMSLYMVTRGVDNNEVASENDGELYELSFPPLTAGNLPPSVNAGPDQTIRQPSSAILDGTVSDDGLPNPPGTVTATWKQLDGPGTATFANAGAVDTTVTFSAPGTYTLDLTASDGELTASDTIVLTVENAAGTIPLEVRVNATSDDAEEALAGAIDIYGSDLELVEDASVQTVGMRFKSLAIPKGAAIASAYVQFKVDETSSGATTLIVQGQAADNAATFTTAAFNVSSRLRTIAAVPWAPAAWTTVGAMGAAQRTPDLGPVIQEIVGRAGWASGNSLVIIITGAGRRVAESFNGDVAGAPLLHVDYLSTPMSVNDVAVTGVAAPTPVTLGEAQTVTVNVANQGSSAETFQVSLSDSLAATVGAPQTVTNLAAGGSQAVSFAWTPNVTGTHTLTATAATVSGETDTADNVRTATSVVSAVPVNDVAVIGVVAPTPVTLGQVQAVTVNVSNQGTLAETFLVSLSDDLGATFGPAQTVTGLAAGGSQAVSLAWTPTVTGTHTLTATAATVAGETDIADNTGTATSVVNPVPVNDVAVTGVVAPTPVTLGQPQTVTVNVANQGTGTETFVVSLGDSLAATVGAPQTVTNLAAGGSRAVSFAWTPSVAGAHTLTATAATVAGETDIADNVGTAISVVNIVTVHDVAVTGVTAPTPVTVGQPQTVTVNVANQGTFVETFMVSLGDSLAATVGAPQTATNLAAGGSQALTFAWTPSVTGTHTLTATAATVSGETDTADNVGTKTAEAVNSSASLEVRISTGNDDAEEALAGTVDRTNSDLELVQDASIQTVGLRFNAVKIPKGATITNAYIQFKVDETSSAATALNDPGPGRGQRHGVPEHGLQRLVPAPDRRVRVLGARGLDDGRGDRGRPTDAEPRPGHPGDRQPAGLGERKLDGDRRHRDRQAGGGSLQRRQGRGSPAPCRVRLDRSDRARRGRDGSDGADAGDAGPGPDGDREPGQPGDGRGNVPGQPGRQPRGAGGDGADGHGPRGGRDPGAELRLDAGRDRDPHSDGHGRDRDRRDRHGGQRPDGGVRGQRGGRPRCRGDWGRGADAGDAGPGPDGDG